MSTGVEMGDYMRAVLWELHNPGASLRGWQEKIAAIHLYVVMGARTVFDALETRATVSDRRVTIDVATL